MKNYPKALEFSKRFNLAVPIIQAPMAGADNNDLVMKVNQAGALGSRGMGYMQVEKLLDDLNVLKTENITNFNVNLFVPQKITQDITCHDFNRKVEKLKKYLICICDELEIDLNTLKLFDPQKRFEEQFAVVLDNNIPILSTTFGTLSSSAIMQCHKKDIYLIGTATTLDEAKKHEALGYDAVVMQGIEAGGHRGGFQETSLVSQMTLDLLIESVLPEIKIPIIAAGGIRSVSIADNYLEKGVSALQIGTAFLACENCTSISNAYRELLHSQKEIINITPAISGRNARGIQNQLFILLEKYYNDYPEDRLMYPFIHLITAPIRKKAALLNNAQYIAAWSGESSDNLDKKTVAEFVNTFL